MTRWVRSGHFSLISHVRFTPNRWGNRPAFLWIAEDLGAALQADGETRSPWLRASSIRRRSAESGAGETEFGLPLTKALAEANHAQFRIKSAPGPELWSRSRSRAIVRSPTEGAAPRRALRSSFCRDCR